MSDYDVIYVDDERNAPFGVDRRRLAPAGRRRPSGRVVVPSGGARRPAVIENWGGAPSGHFAPPFEHYPAPYGAYPAPYGAYPAPYGAYPAAGATMAAPIARFWNLPGSELIEMAAKGLAAIMPLPDAPIAEGETGIDIDNLVEYQTRLAEHAKRDERLRTIGELLGRILR